MVEHSLSRAADHKSDHTCNSINSLLKTMGAEKQAESQEGNATTEWGHTSQLEANH